MEQLTVLVTSDGRRVLSEGDEFFTTLGALAVDRDPTGFAVRNLGFIRFKTQDRGVTAIELHPGTVDRRALLAAMRRIKSSGPGSFRITYLDAHRPREIAVSGEQAIARLGTLLAPAAPPASTERFHVEAQGYARLARGRESPLRMLSERWRACGGRYDPSVIAFAGDNGLAAQMTVVGVSPRDADPVFRFLGDGFPWLPADYHQRAVGDKVETLPDKEYGAWVAGFHRAVAQSGEPRFDYITASVRGSPGRGRSYLIRYERLLLPWQTASGETLISSVARRLVEPPHPPSP